MKFKKIVKIQANFKRETFSAEDLEFKTWEITGRLNNGLPKFSNWEIHSETKWNKNANTGYSFWDRLRNFLNKLTWIVLSVHKLNKLGNSGKFMDNCWISCQVMDDMEKFYDDLMIINL